jgi:putative transferase (TIGR04331 family)
MWGIREAQQLVPTALRAIQDFLQEIHRQEYSAKYVQLVHGMWALHLCHEVVYVRQQRNQREATEDLTVVIPLGKPAYPSKQESGVLSRAALIQLATNDSARICKLQLNSQVEVPRQQIQMARLKDQLLSSLAHRDAKVWVSEPYLQLELSTRMRAVWHSRALMQWNDLNRIGSISTEANLRARLAFANRSSHDDSPAGLLAMLVALSLPIEMAEALPALEKKALSLVDIQPKLVYTANSHHFRTAFKVAAAQLTASGSSLCVHQHGGGVGIDELHIGENFDREVADYFFTFGWRDPNDQRVQPLLTSPRAVRSTANVRILLMCAEHVTEFFRFQSFCLPEHSGIVLWETRSFLSVINSASGLHLRMAPGSPIPLALLGDLVAKCTIADTSESGAVAASRAALVVHNYLGTSWLETLAMNVPTVCFYDPEFYRPRVEARPFLDALVRVGVLHYSGSEAAKFVNSLRGNPAAWWQSAEVQEAREAFVARYANFSDNWLEAWTEEFERLLS